MPGSPTGITVSTSKDIMSAGAPSGSLGGQVTGVSFTIAAADRVPYASGKTVTLGFTIATALSSNDQITLMYPSSFISDGTPWPSVIGSVSGLSVQTMSGSSVSIRVEGSLPAGAHVLTLSGVRFGGATAGSPTGITVSTSKDFTGAGAPSGSLGGQVTGVSFTIAAADRVPYASGKTVTLGFTIATALSSNDQITLMYPLNFISFSATAPIVSGSAGGYFAMAPILNSVSIRVEGSLPAGAHVLTLSGVTFGGATPGSPTGITVSTSKDFTSAGAPSGSLGGQVTGVSFTIAAADRVPYASGKTVTLGFTIATALSANDQITLMYPLNFISFSATAPIVSGSAGGYFAMAPILSSVSIRVEGSLPAGAHVLTLSGVTFGGATPGSPTGITVSTSKDFTSAGAPSGSLGGQVTGVSFTIAAADRVPYASGKTVTLGFTIATALSANDQITLMYPSSFISDGTPWPSVIGSVSGLSVQTMSGSSVSIRVEGSLPAGAHVLTLSGVRFGGATAGSPTGITVSTSKDFTSAGAPSGSLVRGDICIMILPNAMQCSVQSAYMVTVLSPLFCPPGHTWFPLTMHGNCPSDLPMLPAHQCRVGSSAPSFCSVNSIKMSQTPGLCTPGYYPGLLGFDSSGCPIAPNILQPATAPQSPTGTSQPPSSQNAQSPAHAFTSTQPTSTDTTAPVVVFSSIVKQRFESEYDKTVVVSVLLEDPSSFRFVYLDFKTSRNRTLSCPHGQYSRLGTPQYIFGNQSKAFFRMSCSFPFHISVGQYSVHIHAVDRAFNSLRQELGSFAVTSGVVGDNEPPILVSSSISPQFPSPEQTVSGSIQFQDPGGLWKIEVAWKTFRNNLPYEVRACYGYGGAIGNSHSFTFSCSLNGNGGTATSLPNGRYVLHAEAYDNNGNYFVGELASQNISGSIEDYDAPILVSSSISTQNITPGQTVDISFRLEDISGIQSVNLKLNDPQYNDVMYYCQSANGMPSNFVYPVSVVQSTSSYQVSCKLAAYNQIANGRYSFEVLAVDRSFNRLNVQLGTIDVVGGIDVVGTLNVTIVTLSQIAYPGQTVLASFELRDSTGFQFVMLSWRNSYGHELLCASTGRTLAPVSVWDSGSRALYNDFCTLPGNANGTYSVQLSAFDRNGGSLFRELGAFSVPSPLSGSNAGLAAVSGVSISMASTDLNPMQVTVAAVTVAFTTATALPVASKVTITLPANYFTGKAQPLGVLLPAAGAAALAHCSLTAPTLAIVCTTATADLPAGAHRITFAAGELTTGPARSASATGLTVSTSADAASAGAAVPGLGSLP
jgi:hypothetical protein